MRTFLYIFLLLTSGFLFAEYKNTNGVASDKTFGDMLKWIRSDIEPQITKIELSSDWQKLNLSEDDNYAVWIGHSTFLIKKNGVTILTDPIFSKRASPFRNIGPKRLIPPAIPLDAIPNIDIVTVSHNHYDHLDIHSLKKISNKHPEAIFLVPAGDEKLLKRKKIRNVYDFDWWESIEHKGFVITFTPVQHWSKRSLFDRNKSLWGGWFFDHEGLFFISCR
jgi:L-ascorbate metabolism protein UlaG (beta-lactamase superfamily)